MKKAGAILQTLRDEGHRMTKARKEIVTLISASEKPLAADEVLRRLEERGLTVNRSTIYREIAFLKERGLIHELFMRDGKARYRVCPPEHHHHLICLKCNRADAVTMPHDLDPVEKRIARTKDFEITGHSLEFFGVCGLCREQR